MDQKRLFIAIAASIAILLGFQLLVAPRLPHQQTQALQQRQEQAATNLTPREGSPGAGAPAAAAAAQVPKEVPRLRIAGPRVQGSMSLLGARLDDLVLSDYK